MFKLRNGTYTVAETESISQALSWLRALETLPDDFGAYVEDCSGEEDVYYSRPQDLERQYLVAA